MIYNINAEHIEILCSVKKVKINKQKISRSGGRLKNELFITIQNFGKEEKYVFQSY